MSSLKYIERQIIGDLFNQSGYVLNFSTEGLDLFTYDSIGISICDKYKLSKGKSLMKFVSEGEDVEVGKLILDLLEYYKMYYSEKLNEESNLKRYEECIKIANKLYKGEHSIIKDKQSSSLVKLFNSHYIGAQIEKMNNSINDSPYDAIGIAKELLESCCKTILNDFNITIDKNWNVQKLTKETCKVLKLTPQDIDDRVKASETIKQILGSLATISHGMAELRNSYGSGHGKSANFKGLSPRHANLAVGTSVSVVKFIWDTYEEQKGVNEVEVKI